MKEHIYDTFDRAYSLDKETQIITEEEIGKEAEEYADKEHQEGIDDWGILYSGYYQGMKDALGKQTETITQEEIEKAAEKYQSDSNVMMSNFDPADIEDAFINGANFTLGKQEKDSEDTMIQGWITRDDDDTLMLFVGSQRPFIKTTFNFWGVDTDSPYMELPKSLLPEITRSNSPEEVEIIIKRKKK